MLLNIFLGVGLSAASGFRVFMPFLALNIAASGGYVDLTPDFMWIAAPQLRLILLIAVIVEAIAYEIPWFNNLVNMFSIPFAIIAGTILTASFLTEISPINQWALAIIAGGGTALATDIFSNTSHIALTTVTAGTANPILALIESAVAIAITIIVILAITAPIALILIPVLIKLFRNNVRRKVRLS